MIRLNLNSIKDSGRLFGKRSYVGLGCASQVVVESVTESGNRSSDVFVSIKKHILLLQKII
jgi:hypothetical protein